MEDSEELSGTGPPEGGGAHVQESATHTEPITGRAVGNALVWLIALIVLAVPVL